MTDASRVKSLWLLGVAAFLGVSGGYSFWAHETRTSLAFGQQQSAQNQHKTVIFNRDIRPILSDRCFSCHGFDEKKRQSGFRLDTRESAFGELPKHKGKRAFVPGNVQESYALARILSEDPAEMMPPPTARHLKLNDHEKGLIKKWIEEGAEWQEHWAFVTPKRPEVPAVEDGWAFGPTAKRNEIDAFVLRKLHEEGLKPSTEADKATLIRRVSLDLTGLPPTVEEVEAFVKDTAPDAYERVVDRLLASPRYGEHMAASWLDEARYADSHGFQSDPERHQWHWRDWVIGAFNRNMPYDQFVSEQIAGDLIAEKPEVKSQKSEEELHAMRVATGFNRNHRQNSEGGIIDEEWRVETVVDRVETTSGSILGLTFGCARCHDHKYDPMSQKEFYEFSAYFNSINERGEYFSVGLDKGINGVPVIKCYSPEVKEKLAKLKGEMAAEEGKIAALMGRLPEFEEKYKREGMSAPEPSGLALRFALDGDANGVTGEGAAAEQVVPPVVTATQPGGRPAEKKEGAAKKTVVPVAATRPAGTVVEGKFEAKDGTNFGEGKLGKAIKFDGKGTAFVDAGADALAFDRADAFSYGAWVNLQGGDGTVLSKMEAGPVHRGFDLYLGGGGKVMPHIINKWPENAVKVVTASPLPLNKWVHVMVTYDGSSKASGVKVYFDGVQQSTTPEQDNLRRTIKSKAPLLIGKRVDGSPLSGSVDDVRIYSRALTREEVVRLAVGPDLETLVKVEPAKRTDEQKAKLASALLAPLEEYQAAVGARDKAKGEVDKIEGDPRNTTMVMEDLPKPRDTFILNRGQYDHRGEKVGHGVPAMISQAMSKDVVAKATMPANRLGLAQWMVSPENPLTARVRVNRLWEQFFGTGIVKTSENFGVQAQWPSHPELLDWLATEFVARKWDVKGMQKMIVTSATYRQSSNVTRELVERDPENRLLARGPRLRLTAEQVRDQALAASGLLVEKLGGPSVRPYQPEDLWAGNLFGNLVKYEVGKGEELYRRTLYTFLKRTAAPANQMVWDMPSREFCLVKRSRTNTPLQALNVMNDPTYVEAARVLAERMLKEGGADGAERIRYAFKRVVCRPPNEAEMKVLEGALEKQLEHYRKDVEGAAKLVKVGADPVEEGVNPSELAAYTMVASVMLNLDEAVNKN